MHKYNFTVKEHHLDTFAHVNNAQYLALFEEARWDLITNNGYGIDKIRETGLGPVVLEIVITFKRELTLRKQITIESEVVSKGVKISKINQKMIDSEGHLCCEATFTFALFELKKRKIVSPTEDWIKALG